MFKVRIVLVTLVLVILSVAPALAGTPRAPDGLSWNGLSWNSEVGTPHSPDGLSWNGLSWSLDVK
jgi:hypothetical protein